MPSPMERDVRRACAAWNRALILAALGESAGLVAAGAGVVVLVGRALGADVLDVALGLAAVVAVARAARRAVAARVDPASMATLLDLRLGGRGDLLHALDAGAPDALPRAWGELTRPRPAGRRVARALLPGVAFLVLATLVPVRRPPVSVADPLAGRRLEELRELVLALDETLELDDALAEEVRANLDSAEAGARDDQLSGEALHEALDRVEASLGSEAGRVAEQLDVVRRELAAAASAADGAGGQEAVAELDALARELEALGALPDGTTAASLAAMSPVERAAALDGAAADMLERLAARGLLDAKGLERGGEGAGGKTPLAALAKRSPFFDPLKPKPKDAAGLCTGSGTCPGGHAGPCSGGVSRGRADAELTWGAETPELAEALEVRPLPPPRSFEEAMQVLAVARTAPSTDPCAEGVRTDAPAAGTRGDATAHRRLKPGHREVVRQWFDQDP